MNLYDIYYKLPLDYQNILISLYGYYWRNHRFGGVFYQEYKAALAREFYSFDEWNNYSTNELRRLLLHAFDTVPFYKEKYKKKGITRNFLSTISLDQICELPYLEKEELRKFGKTTLLSTNKEKGIFNYSSGSTGTPTAVYFSKRFHQKWFAICEARIRNWAGVSKDNPRGMIGGRRIIPDSILKPPYYRYNSAEKQTYFSAYHLTPKTVHNYVEGMYKNHVEYMTGYAMSNFILADFIEINNLEVPKLKAVLTSSEKLTPEMRKTIERVYDCKTYDGYSGSEACGLISETCKGDLLVSPDVGIMEFIKDDGSYAHNGEEGEIVSTGFLNYDQPLIRYRIGDRARLSLDQKLSTNHSMVKIEEILGRVEDVVVGRDGRAMVRFHSLYLDIKGLISAQIIQHDYERFSFNLVCDSSFSKKLAETILKKRLESQLGNIEIQFNYLKNLPIEKNGKIKAVISNL